MDQEKIELTAAGRLALINIFAGRGAWHGISELSTHSGYGSTLLALRRAGLVGLDEALTPEGLAMAEHLAQVPT
jgi:hypothetical protein